MNPSSICVLLGNTINMYAGTIGYIWANKVKMVVRFQSFLENSNWLVKSLPLLFSMEAQHWFWSEVRPLKIFVFNSNRDRKVNFGKLTFQTLLIKATLCFLENIFRKHFCQKWVNETKYVSMQALWFWFWYLETWIRGYMVSYFF